MAGGTILIGQIAFVNAGVYDVAKTYKNLHYVTTMDSTYLSLKDNNVGNPITDILSWKCLADGKPATEAATLCKNATTKSIQATTRADTATNEANLARNKANTSAELANTKADEANDAAILADEKTNEAHATIIRIEELADSLVGQYKAIPKSIILDYLEQITLGNTVSQRIRYDLFPVNTGRNVLFLGDNNAVMLSPNGEFALKKLGVSVIHAIPTENTEITKTIQITVVAPDLRKVGSSLRLMGNGKLRLT